jgi:uncharacterized repeat protein (TIGR02543 family)
MMSKRNTIKCLGFVILIALIGFLFAACPYEPIGVTVKYDANGGSGMVPASQTVKAGDAITVPDKGNLAYPGKTFTGWYDKAEMPAYYKAFAPSTAMNIYKDTTLYAQWADNVYTVSYDANGGDGAVPSKQTAKEGATITVSGQGSLTYTGKNFDGWNTEPDGSGTSYAKDDSVPINGDITLYAQWTDIQYTVTYHANGGTGAVPESQSVDWGGSITLASGDGLERNGYHFGGWNTMPAGTGTNYDAGSSFAPTSYDSNITLYALWIAPRIKTGDTYKVVTSGWIRIHLETDDRYIFSETEEYRLYRSTTQSGTYTVVATISPSSELILEDRTADWLIAGSTLYPSSYYYKVAAVSGGIEAMSTNGVKINMVSPRVYMRYSYSTYLPYGYCAVGLENNDGGDMHAWAGTTTSFSPEYELLITTNPKVYISPGKYTLYTGTVSTQALTNQGSFTIRASHEHTITVSPNGSLLGSFDKSNWTFFTP